MAGSVSSIWRSVTLAGMALGFTLFATPRACDQRVTVFSTEPLNKPIGNYVEVIVVKAEGEPASGKTVALFHGEDEIDRGKTDTEAGRVYLMIKNVDRFNTGSVVLYPDKKDANKRQTYNITYDANGANGPYIFDLANEAAYNPVNLPDKKVYENGANGSTVIASDTDTAPVLPLESNKNPIAKPQPTPTPTPLLFIDEFADNQRNWKTGNVEKPHSDYIVGKVELTDGFLKLSYINLVGFWTHSIDVPTDWEVKNFVHELDYVVAQLPEDGAARIHNQFRLTPNGSCYSLVISSNGEVTLFFTDANNRTITLERFQSADYNPAEGSLNKLTLKVTNNVFEIRINGGDPFTYTDDLKLIDQPGRFRISVDGPANYAQTYHLSRIIIQESIGQ